ncbi:TonB-dependent receptor [Sphingopyxis granuli]|uniref:TonB-dependent receptor n=1 Tax=Sphingopyxis granuli TaxID=267128 RepID=UPI0012E77C1B|nr:TonB-dependent receptor [Sphingopyxis granuli]
MAVPTVPAHAETDKGDVAAGPVSRETAPPGVILPLRRADELDEIVVTADRYGEAKVAAESEFDEEEIASHGADSIQDLLTRLSPFIDPSGEEPVILINGKPAGFDRSILSYPAEALQRLAVLKPEAAAQYGEPAGKRVVNLVLKKHFSMWNADAGVDFATAGGQYGGKLSANRTAIDGDIRWNARARIAADSAFRKSARALPPRDGVFDSVGFVSAPDGGEIDPALSLIAGEPVTAAAIPPESLAGAGAGAGVPGLADFAATANALHPADPNAYETLQSSRRTASLAIGVTRPLGAFTASLNLNASRSSSDGQRGLPMVSVLIPAGSPWSPFADDVLLTRPFAGERALRNASDSTALGASLTLNGSIGSWQTNFGINYARGWASNLLETCIDRARIQQAIAADAAFDPYGPWDESLLLATRGRTRSENLSARLNVRKTIIDLPAGPMVWNLTANASRNRSHSWQEGGGEGDGGGDAGAVERRTTRHQTSGQMTLSLPIARRGEAGPAWLGDLSLDLSASTQAMTGSRTQKRYGANVSWSPWSIVQLRGSIDRAEAAPSFDQLDAPIVTTVTRVFDYARQEVAEPLWITGGNPDLRGGSRQSVSLAATLRPLGGQALTLNLGYRQSVAKGGVAGFPELTPAIEAAFPERVTRDAEGRLVAVDARAINIARDTDAELSSGIALRLGQARAGERSVADPLQFSVSVNHRYRLKSELLTRSGLPAIDQLRAGGQSRHNLSMQLSVGKRGIGANLSGNWSSPGRLRGAADDADAAFRFKPPLTFNLSAFVEPDRLFALSGKKGALNGLKISVDVRNLFNGYRRVTLADGRVPSGYSRNEIDPLGRTLSLTARKRF